MAARDKSRFSPRQAGWIAVGIFAAWLVFLLVPTPRKAKPPASNELPPMAAQSKLESVGLVNNPDWYGLPDYFAIWADQFGPDEKNPVQFAYWNPGSRSYSYFFEARRKKGGYQFRALSRKESAVTEHLVTEHMAGKSESDTHPFVFPYMKLPPNEELAIYPVTPDAQAKKIENPQVKVELPTVRLEPPKTLDLEQSINGPGK